MQQLRERVNSLTVQLIALNRAITSAEETPVTNCIDEALQNVRIRKARLIFAQVLDSIDSLLDTWNEVFYEEDEDEDEEYEEYDEEYL